MTSWPPSKTATTHLGELEYHDLGEGPPLVFLHLVLASGNHWDTLTPLLTDQYRCIVPTLPMGAHNVPAAADADLSPEGLAKAVVDLIDALGLDSVTLVGNDTGGAIAQIVAADHPDRVDRVVLTNCDMYDDFPPKMFVYLKWASYIPGNGLVMGTLMRSKPLLRLPFVFGRLAHNIDATKIGSWAAAMRASRGVRRDGRKVVLGLHPRSTNRAAKILRSTTIPFLVVWGADDKAFKPALAERFCSEVPTASLEMVAGSKTFVCWDQPERLAQHISSFVPTEHSVA